MDFNSDRASDYEVGTSDDRRNGDAAVDTGGVQMKHSVEHHRSSSSMSSPRFVALGRLFVGGVSCNTTEESFANYFRRFGEVVDSVIITDGKTGRRKGYGFVTFPDSADAEKVLEKEHVIDDKKVYIGRAVPIGDIDTDITAASNTRRVFVGRLPPLLEEDELKNYFCEYGNIINHHIVYDPQSGRSRRFGFITFQSEDSVDRLLSDGKVHELRGKQVGIERAELKSRRRGNSLQSYGATGKRDQEDRYGGKVHEDYNMYSGYGCYGGNGAYAGNSMVNPAGFYGYGGYGGNGAYAGNSMVNPAGFYGYCGGYGYGYGYGDQMFNLGYGAGGSSYMGGGNGGSAATAYGGGNAHGNGNSGSSSDRGNGTNGSGPARDHS